jgi:CheY-like chemotaxis protein
MLRYRRLWPFQTLCLMSAICDIDFRPETTHVCAFVEAVMAQSVRPPNMGFLRTRQGCSTVNLDGAAKLLEAVAKLIGVVIWPTALVYVLVKFRSDIGYFVSNMGEMTVKGAGFEATAKRRQSEAGAALVAATVSRPEENATAASTANAAKEAVQAVGDVNARTLRRIEDSRVLWVDDRPDNNEYERQALEALGLKIVISTSTDDALAKIGRQHFDAIISDMGRPPDPQAGYTLLEKLRASGDKVPFIIYASSRLPEHQAEAKRRGAVGCTNRATELFAMVVSALSR